MANKWLWLDANGAVFAKYSAPSSDRFRNLKEEESLELLARAPDRFTRRELAPLLHVDLEEAATRIRYWRERGYICTDSLRKGKEAVYRKVKMNELPKSV